MTTFKSIESLEENPSEVFLEVTSVLLKLVDNVIMYPSNPKYRKLRLENKIISSVILPSIGAMECLFELGFQENGDSLLLPPEQTSIEKLNQFRKEISNRRNKYLKTDPSSSSNQDKCTTSTASVSTRQPTPQLEATSQPRPNENPSGVLNPSFANPFLTRLHTQSSLVLQYELDPLKKKVLSLVPLDKISEQVQSRMRLLQKQTLKDSEPLNEGSLQETIFFTELMAWFKNEFFQWVNSPKCMLCESDTQFLEMSTDPRELRLADRVEVYKCKKCGGRTLFPRYNDVTKLLETRRGRCGEWANVFTAICRTLNWEARFVWDETDHVWTEVFFKSEQRWVHCDPCECAIDKPLLYEKGWKKQLSYVIGFAHDHIQDVTWRYSANHKVVLSRRRHLPETQLVKFITTLNNNRQEKVSERRRKELARRAVRELVQLMVPAVETEGDSQGRQSGSLSWRLARSETSIAQETSSYVFTPAQEELEAKRMTISYSPVNDEYFRSVTKEKVKGWRSRTFSVENIQRKEEKDWKMVYLCRAEGSVDDGKISWKVDVSKSGFVVNQVDVKCLSTTFKSAKVRWLLCSGDKCVPVYDGSVKTAELRGCTELTLTATLQGGEGEMGWQHAQLFRQPLNASDTALQISITFSSS